MFQFSDLNEVPPETNEELEGPRSIQPEEEPGRRISNVPPPDIDPADIPIPDLNDQDWDRSSIHTPSTPSASVPEGENNEVTGETGSNNGENTAVNNTANGEDTEVSFNNTVYNAFFVESNVNGSTLKSDEETLWDADKEDPRPLCEYEFEVPQQHVHRFLRDPKTHVALLATSAKRAKSEVRYSDLEPEEKELFKQAKPKELGCWLETSSVRKIMRSKISPERIMTSRWILTWKPDPSNKLGKKAKARLVVRGYQDPEIDQVNTESPTLSRDARMLLLQVVSSYGWTIQNFDITTAFLRGRSDGRQLAMEPVSELKSLLKMTDDEVLMLDGNADGRVDAPLLFYKEFRRQLEKIGFEAHPLDNCLFMLRNKQNPEILDGIF